MSLTSIATNQSERLEAQLSQIIVGKLICGLDLEASSDLRYTDKFIIYLSENKKGALNSAFMMWKIYGFRETPEEKMILCSDLVFCYGQHSEHKSLPDKFAFDRKDLSHLEDKELNSLLEQNRIGLSRAIGQGIMSISLSKVNSFPRLYIGLGGRSRMYGISVSYDESLDEEEGRFQLWIYND